MAQNKKSFFLTQYLYMLFYTIIKLDQVTQQKFN